MSVEVKTRSLPSLPFHLEACGQGWLMRRHSDGGQDFLTPRERQIWEAYEKYVNDNRNAHDELLAALERINEFAWYTQENQDARDEMLLAIGNTARAALQKAEGK